MRDRSNYRQRRTKLRELRQLQTDLSGVRSLLRSYVDNVNHLGLRSLSAIESEVFGALNLRDYLIDRIETLTFDMLNRGIRFDATLLEPTYRDEDVTASAVLTLALAGESPTDAASLISVGRAVAETIAEIGSQRRAPLIQLPPLPQLIVPDLARADQRLVKYLAEHPQYLTELNPRVFEELLQEVFSTMGYETQLGPRSGDGGVDLRLMWKGDFGPSVILVQAKRWKERPVTIECVSALYGVVQAENATKGVLATTSRFLPSAQRFAQRVGHRLFLADSARLVQWIKRVATSP